MAQLAPKIIRLKPETVLKRRIRELEREVERLEALVFFTKYGTLEERSTK